MVWHATTKRRAASGGWRPVKYRPDIDGLRAVAVLAVIGFHAFPNWVPGGFVGVDIFFVISGYLISGIIFSALERNAFSFRDFYARRIRRIFPALILVLAASYGVGWFVLFADRFAELGKHLAGGAGFVANYVLWREAGYFDGASDTKPLLHLWSLGVEEQFYMIWPLAAWLAWKRRLDLLVVTLAVFLASMYFNLDRIRRDLIGTFYAPHTRFWELMAGAALAQMATMPPRLAVSRWLRDRYQAIVETEAARTAISVAGAVTIAASIFLIDQSRHFPGRWAILPVAGAALMVTAGPDAWINRRILALPFVVFVGLISYPLYLWHWPVLSILRLAVGETPSAGARWAAVALSFVLAWLTYAVIERPIRFGPRRRMTVAVLCVLMTAVGITGYYTYAADGLWGRAVNRSDKAPFSAYYEVMRKKGIEVPYRLECDFMELVTDRVKDRIAPGCTALGVNGTWFLWGDSHAQALSPGITSLLPQGVALAQVATSACRPSLGPIDLHVPGERCARANTFALEKIAELKPEVVILAQGGGHAETDWDALARHVRGLGVRRVIVVGPAPMWQPSLPEIFINRYWETRPARIAYGLVAERETMDRQLRDRYAQSETLTYVSIMARFCDTDGCLAIVPGTDPPELTAFDAAHLTPLASRYLADQLLRPVLIGTGGR
jgi:peptidoglycan/LPS O-acetylase OafA/YrhL